MPSRASEARADRRSARTMRRSASITVRTSAPSCVRARRPLALVTLFTPASCVILESIHRSATGRQTPGRRCGVVGWASAVACERTRGVMNDETGSLDEKLRKKERAEEAVFFGKRDRALVKHLRETRDQTLREELRELTHMRCPD